MSEITNRESVASIANTFGASSHEPKLPNTLQYNSGFGNLFETEALPGALPHRQNNPQNPPYGLYGEWLSGTTFFAARTSNLYAHTFRIRPSVEHSRFERIPNGLIETPPFETQASPNQMRWDPFEMPDEPLDFVDGMATLAGNGNVASCSGMAIHIYRANRSMQNRAFVNADGQMLIVPQTGQLRIVTEMGIIEASPREIVLIPRGIRFRVELLEDVARGYICENFGVPFALPELGPIGTHGLANRHNFLAPVAAFEDTDEPCQLVQKYYGNLWAASLSYSPMNIVAWRGTLTPYKYDTNTFVPLGTVSVDHADPSILTVLTSAGHPVGGANVDFCIFPPRWTVAEDTFRPPPFHRNVMPEFMGIVHGKHYSRESGFLPGGASLHNSFAPHGPDVPTTERARRAELSPQKLDGHLAFLFETCFPLQATAFALNATELQKDYIKEWHGFKNYFRESKKV